jgi:hypothetical protein
VEGKTSKIRCVTNWSWREGVVDVQGEHIEVVANGGCVFFDEPCTRFTTGNRANV